MVKYLLTNKAVEDLANIWYYTYAEWSPGQADKYYELLIYSFEELAENPNRGKKYDGIANSLLGYKSNEHIIFYHKIDNKKIEIVRILHGSMDLKSKF